MSDVIFIFNPRPNGHYERIVAKVAKEHGYRNIDVFNKNFFVMKETKYEDQSIKVDPKTYAEIEAVEYFKNGIMSGILSSKEAFFVVCNNLVHLCEYINIAIFNGNRVFVAESVDSGWRCSVEKDIPMNVYEKINDELLDYAYDVKINHISEKTWRKGLYAKDDLSK